MAVSAAQAPIAQPPSQLLAGKTPVAAADPPAEAAANPNQQMYDSLKADLESQGPVGGSRSYKTKANGDVVILNSQRTVLPKTGIKTVDKVSKEITPTVDNTRNMVKDVFHSTSKAAIYGGITGAIVGIMRNTTPVLTAPNRKNIGRMAFWTLTLAAFGAAISALFQGVKAGINGSRKVTSSAYDAMQGIRKKSAPESK